jgi:uncharacterized protein (DUF1800 family)
MRAHLMQAGFIVAATVLCGAPVNAGTIDDPGGVQIVRGGVDALVPVTAGEPLRITASGAISYDLAAPACASVDPRGCRDADAARPRPDLNSPAAALIGTFVDERGVPVAQSFAPGDAALVAVPAGARELALSVNLGSGQSASGEFTVAALPAVVRPRPMAAPVVMTPRMKAQHLLRRFGFSASPELITQIVKQGVDNWFVQQLTPSSIDDSVALSKIEPLPTRSNSTGGYDDWNVFERRLIEREIYTKRQVQEKMVLHWLDHFSISIGGVGDPALMSNYESVLRAQGLGNFATLASDVARTPAMLYWLDNNYNNGSDPIHNPPNENFARELMQLFTIGPYQLNIDGTPKTDAAGVPLPSFTETDVKHVAQGLTGFYVDYDWGVPYSNPETRFKTMFASSMHTPGGKTILGTYVNVPDGPGAAFAVIDSLASYSSSAPFLAKELLQRVATENPSPRYVAEIATVWQKYEHSADQIAKVLEAIERDPEFYTTDYHSMPKEPVELLAQFARDMPVILKEAHYSGGGTNGPGSSLLWYLNLALQEPYDPPSVFSFYTPGHKEQLISQVALLDRFNDIGDITGDEYTYSWVDTGFDLSSLRARIGPKNTDPATVEAYLLDAMVDSDSSVLATTVKTYLGTAPVDDQHLAGAVWLISTSPEFEVN